jgi:hypothetical protein
MFYKAFMGRGGPTRDKKKSSCPHLVVWTLKKERPISCGTGGGATKHLVRPWDYQLWLWVYRCQMRVPGGAKSWWDWAAFYVHARRQTRPQPQKDAERKEKKKKMLKFIKRRGDGRWVRDSVSMLQDRSCLHVSLSASVKSIQVKVSCDVVHEVSMKQSVWLFPLCDFFLICHLNHHESVPWLRRVFCFFVGPVL